MTKVLTAVENLVVVAAAAAIRFVAVGTEVAAAEAVTCLDCFLASKHQWGTGVAVQAVVAGCFLEAAEGIGDFALVGCFAVEWIGERQIPAD